MNQGTPLPTTGPIDPGRPTVPTGPADKIISEPSSSLDDITRLNQWLNVVILHQKAEQAEKLKPNLSSLDKANAVTLLRAQADELDKHIESILKPRGLVNQFLGKETSQAKAAAQKLGLKPDGDHAKFVEDATILRENLKEFNQLEKEISPDLARKNYVGDLKERMDFLIREIKKKIIEQQHRIQEQKKEIEELTGQIMPGEGKTPPQEEQQANWKRATQLSADRTCPVTQELMLQVT